MDIAILCHDLEKSLAKHEWREKLAELVQIVRSRPRECRSMCIALSSVCIRAFTIFEDEITRRKAISCLCELAYDNQIVLLWDINSAEVELLIVGLENGSEGIRSLAKEGLARWAASYPERMLPLVRFLIARLRFGPNPPLKAMDSLVHLSTELLGGEERVDGERLFQAEVRGSIKMDDEFEPVRRALIMLHISEKDKSERESWIELTTHFMERRGALLNTVEHHASIQRIFFQEVLVKFSFDVTLRLANMAVNLPGYNKLSMVLACVADHLEDFQTRLKAREAIFCEETRRNVKLTRSKRIEVYAQMTQLLSAPLIGALGWALAPRMPPEMVEAQNKECYQLLEEKTRITAENHDQLAEVEALAYQCVAMAEKSSDLLHHMISARLVNESQRFMQSTEVQQLHARLLTARRANVAGGKKLPSDFAPSRLRPTLHSSFSSI
eukprot:GEMP01030346.1.p1 GENE.GEMP01030346.1~~GEMP01030346.1.p1  ORF type:complete len:441 (+),score=98.93 GEMP01030346.1:851-2173(+)